MHDGKIREGTVVFTDYVSFRDKGMYVYTISPKWTILTQHMVPETDIIDTTMLDDLLNI